MIERQFGNVLSRLAQTPCFDEAQWNLAAQTATEANAQLRAAQGDRPEEIVSDSHEARLLPERDLRHVVGVDD